MRLLVPLLLASILPSWFQLPTFVERWVYNPRERTEVARQHVEEGDAEAALPPLGTAARLAPEDPRVRYNHGTARLLAGRRGAADELAAAADSLEAGPGVDAGLAADTWYNLGTAQLADGNPSAAVGALQSALRNRPSDLDAKFNLELALQQLDEQRSGMGRPQEPSSEGGGGSGRHRDDEETGGAWPPEDGTEAPRPGDDENGDAEGDLWPQPPSSLAEAWQRFEQQPDMTAAQAAALLEAVENIERAHRRAEAERRERRTGSDKDW